MDYKKMYEEALERARKLGTKEMPIDPTHSIQEQIFPELRESEDENIRNALIRYFRHHEPNTMFEGYASKDIVSWLEKQKPVWSEEDEKIRQGLIDRFKSLKPNFSWYEIPIDDIISWLKSFKPHPKQEWSEEDKKHRQWILEYLADGKRQAEDYSEQYQSAFDWLKSLKPNHWRPSEEEMRVLQTVIKDYGICAEKNVLESLYNDLQKL